MSEHLTSINDRIEKAGKVENAVRSAFVNRLKCVEFPPPPYALKILSVSAGNGVWDFCAINAIPNQCEVTATDIVDCPISLEDQDFLKSNCKWQFSKVEAEKSLPFEENIFDLVIHQDVIEHVLNPYQFINEQQRVLKSGGFLLFGTPNLLRPANIIKLMLGKLRFPVKIGSNAEIGDYIHIQEFNEWNLRNLVEEVGLTVLNIDYCFWGFHPFNIRFSSMPENNIGKTMCHHINVFSQKLTR